MNEQVQTHEGRWITCYACGGHGLVPDYSPDGCEFEGAAECDYCEGTKRLWRYPSGALAAYPGGPLRGSD